MKEDLHELATWRFAVIGLSFGDSKRVNSMRVLKNFGHAASAFIVGASVLFSPLHLGGAEAHEPCFRDAPSPECHSPHQRSSQCQITIDLILVGFFSLLWPAEHMKLFFTANGCIQAFCLLQPNALMCLSKKSISHLNATQCMDVPMA